MTNNRIDKKLIKKLADLARLDLGGKEEHFLGDVNDIVGYFAELESVDTDGVKPVVGGTGLFGVFRKDEYIDEKHLDPNSAKAAFPDENDGFLKIPPVFPNEN